MLPLFGILSPAAGPILQAAEAPLKKAFFGNPSEPEALSTAEEEALFLSGKHPEPSPRPASLRR